jgi:hypothetical protein
MTGARPRQPLWTVSGARCRLAGRPALMGSMGSAFPALAKAAQPRPERRRTSLREPAWVRPGLP